MSVIFALGGRENQLQARPQRGSTGRRKRKARGVKILSLSGKTKGEKSTCEDRVHKAVGTTAETNLHDSPIRKRGREQWTSELCTSKRK